ncbi:UPF0691 protein C9orf116 [Papilio machaon]|uniref:UPF0691 protein C9orf116 n=1 Tax=Papilio machaon TaxID=76193 RepID=A0A194R141_PAPMA|nr:UPF0691 protein C9orf116 [Papilio machaon]
MSSGGQLAITDKQEGGFCSATCIDKVCLQNEIKKPEIKTSDLYATCNLPKRFEHPHWFNGYGCQKSNQHPLYRTTSSEYGWYPPGVHSVTSVYYPAGQKFTNHLLASGMYRNYSLNTGMDPVGYS